MNFTLDELINAIKYHGHQYGLTTLEILEGVASDYSEDVLEEKYDDAFHAGEVEAIEKIETMLEKTFDKLIDDINKNCEDMVKEFPKDQAKTLVDADNMRQAITKFYNEIKRKL